MPVEDDGFGGKIERVIANGNGLEGGLKITCPGGGGTWWSAELAFDEADGIEIGGNALGEEASPVESPIQRDLVDVEGDGGCGGGLQVERRGSQDDGLRAAVGDGAGGVREG